MGQQIDLFPPASAEPDPLAIACPKRGGGGFPACKARIGQPCKNHVGWPLRRRDPATGLFTDEPEYHVERKILARGEDPKAYLGPAVEVDRTEDGDESGEESEIAEVSVGEFRPSVAVRP